ncbi:MAG: hypothetical protein COZ05_03410, partial [Armatimonadetes bacterium CG_4_10_14_3_um_filter_59_10]
METCDDPCRDECGPWSVDSQNAIAVYLDIPAVSITRGRKVGKGNRHRIPLRELKVFGRAGKQELQKWRKEWLRYRCVGHTGQLRPIHAGKQSTGA